MTQLVNGFVLKTLKYGDTSLIIHVYTEQEGLKAFLIKGFFNKRKKNLRIIQYPFCWVEISYKANNKNSLSLPLKLETYPQCHVIFQNPLKVLMVQFLAEFCYTLLKNDTTDVNVYRLMEDFVQAFANEKRSYADFHLVFITKLTQCLGIYPNTDSLDALYFDLQEGEFTNNQNTEISTNQQETHLLKQLLTLSQKQFNQIGINFNKVERNLLIEFYMKYFRLHIANFKVPKSLEILRDIVQ